MILDRSRRLSFTLIELLVVVAIISVLAALLLPALVRARQVARQTACTNNFKQLALGAHLYAEDTERLPNLSKGFLGTLGISGPDWDVSWSASEKRDAIRIDHFAQFCTDYLSQAWTYDPAVDRMRVPRTLTCPSLDPNSPDINYFPYLDSYGPTTNGEGLATIGEPAFYYPPWAAGGGTFVGFASFLGMSFDGGSGGQMFNMTSTHLKLNQFAHPDSEVIILDALIQRGGSCLTNDPLSRWRLPHGSNNQPSGLNQVFADGAVRWIPFSQVNRVHVPFYTEGKQAGTPYYCPTDAKFNRGGYPFANIDTPNKNWYGIGFAFAHDYHP